MLRPFEHAGSRFFVLRNSTLGGARRAYSSASRPATSVAQLLLKPATADAHALSSQDGSITLNGFVRTVRKQKRVAFAAISDGTSLDAVQAVLTPEQAKDLSSGSAVRIVGQWQKCPSGKEQSHELLASQVYVLGENDAESNPIQKKYQSTDFLRTIPHLRPRIPFHSVGLRLRSEAIGQATNFFASQGYIQTHPPVITSSDCEGAGEVFNVQDSSNLQPVSAEKHERQEGFFKETKYLTVSSQLHLEALAQAVGKVWTLAPTFRAEHSDTTRHLAEFYMLEAEACFVDDMNEIMDVVEGLIRSITQELINSPTSQELLSPTAQKYREEQTDDTRPIDVQARWDSVLSSKPWPRITYAEAVKLVQEHFDWAPAMGEGLNSMHEKFLAEHVGHGPIFVTDYPRDIKPFYMSPSAVQQDNEQVPTVACFDLLVPDVCEIAGGSMREHRLDRLLAAMDAHGLLKTPEDAVSHAASATSGDVRDLVRRVPANLQWYVDLRRYGSVPHGGFGLGFDRLLCYLSGVSSVRDIVSFPRWYGRCDC